MMWKTLIALGCCAFLAVPNGAKGGSVESPHKAKTESSPRLVSGGASLARLPFSGMSGEADPALAIGHFSAGTLPSATSERGFGAYAGYSIGKLYISSALQGDNAISAAELSAAYVGQVFGIKGTTALHVGYEWEGLGVFSPNPTQAAITADPGRPAGDLSLGLSFTHDLSSDFTLGGFAMATRGIESSGEDEPAVRVGAGVGYRF